MKIWTTVAVRFRAPGVRDGGQLGALPRDGPVLTGTVCP